MKFIIALGLVVFLLWFVALAVYAEDEWRHK